MFLRPPALRDLDAEERTILVRSIGGHPRLIEFVDASLRGGKANNPHRRVALLAERNDRFDNVPADCEYSSLRRGGEASPAPLCREDRHRGP
jgi:hypothetical protein